MAYIVVAANERLGKFRTYEEAKSWVAARATDAAIVPVGDDEGFANVGIDLATLRAQRDEVRQRLAQLDSTIWDKLLPTAAEVDEIQGAVWSRREDLLDVYGVYRPTAAIDELLLRNDARQLSKR